MLPLPDTVVTTRVSSMRDGSTGRNVSSCPSKLARKITYLQSHALQMMLEVPRRRGPGSPTASVCGRKKVLCFQDVSKVAWLAGGAPSHSAPFKVREQICVRKFVSVICAEPQKKQMCVQAGTEPLRARARAVFRPAHCEQQKRQRKKQEAEARPAASEPQPVLA